MGKMGKVGGMRPAMRKGPRRFGPRPARLRRLRGAPRPRKVLFERSGGCSMILAGVIVITSLFILV